CPPDTCGADCGLGSSYAKAGRRGPHGILELHPAIGALHNDFLRPRAGPLRQGSEDGTNCHRGRRLAVAADRLAALAAPFQVWAVGMAVALVDISEPGTVPQDGERAAQREVTRTGISLTGSRTAMRALSCHWHSETCDS